MAVYVVTGVSRGIGYAFLTNLSQDPKHTVIGIVRDRASTLKKISEDAVLKQRSNYHIIEADLTMYESLKKAAAEVAQITGGAIDYLIASAAYVSLFDTFDPLGYLGEHEPQKLEEDFKKSFNINVIGQIHLINVFMPQILKGKTKKVVALTTGFADLDFTNENEIYTASGYSISKAALNMAMAKYNAQYKSQGVHFLSVCPGSVEVGMYKDCTPEELNKLGPLMQKFMNYQPNFTGPVTPEQAVSDMRAVWESTTVEKNGGAFLSQFGNKQWL